MSDHPHTREAMERWRQGKINVFDALAELEDQRDEARATIAWATGELQKIGLHPAYHTTLVSCVQAAKEIVSQLRKDIDEPRPDIQEAVLHKLGLWDIRQQRDEAIASSNERGVVVSQVSGALVDAGCAVGDAREFGQLVRNLAGQRDQWRECAEEALLPLAALKIANQETPITQICPELMDVILAAHDLIFNRLKGAAQ